MQLANYFLKLCELAQCSCNKSFTIFEMGQQSGIMNIIEVSECKRRRTRALADMMQRLQPVYISTSRDSHNLR